MTKTISIILPVYNEAQTIPHLLVRLKALLAQMTLQVEVIFVNDGSSDESFTLLKAAASTNSEFRVINFSRNFGHQMAITCGLEQSHGDAVIVMDADLQDPPELIVQMIEAWQGGHDIVMCKREVRQGETWFKRFSASLFYRLIARMTDVPVVLDAGDFYLLDRQVVNVLNACPERARFLRGLVAWAGFNKKIIPYQRAARLHGESNYTLKKMLRLAKDALFSFSEKPIVFIHMVTGLSMLLSILTVARVLFAYFNQETVPGWATMVILVSFFGGLILCSLGIIGEYVYRIFKETQARSPYIIKEIVHFEKDEKDTETMKQF